jgi:uncharacterized Zn-binding protein involved in type VI secretion
MGAAVLKEAARQLVDPIEHSSAFWGALAGAVVGLVIGVAIVAATIATGGGALVLIGSLLVAAGTVASMTTLGKDIGALIGGLSIFNYNAGDIELGSPNVTVGGRDLHAARVKDPVKCHSGKKIATGCATISINQEPAARVDEKTECSGTIKEGCKTVKYGGPSVEVLKVEDEPTPAWFKWTMEVLDWIGFIGGITSIIKNAGKFALRSLLKPQTWSQFREAAMFAYDVVDKGVFLFDKYAGGAFGEYYEAATGRKPPSWLEKQAYTDSTAYKVAKAGWGLIGAANSFNEAMPTFRRWLGFRDPPTIHLPSAPEGFSRTDGGILVPDAPAGYKATDSGLLVPAPPPRVESPTGGQGTILLPGQSPRVEAPRIIKPGDPDFVLPGEAPRVDKPAGSSSGLILPGDPRFSMP